MLEYMDNTNQIQFHYSGAFFSLKFDVVYFKIEHSYQLLRLDIRTNRIDGVMVSMLSSSALDRWVRSKTIKLVFVAFPLSTHH